MCEAKLSEVRVFLYNEFPKINATVAGEGIILFNFVSSHGHRSEHLNSDQPIYFWLYSLVKGDFNTLANQVMCWSPMVFSSQTKDVLARQFSDYITGCFCFNRLACIQPYLPMLVFVLDIIVDDPHLILQIRESFHQQCDEHDDDDDDCFYLATHKTIVANADSDADADDLPDSNQNKYLVGNYLNHMIRVQEIEESNVDELYQILGALRSLPLYNTNPNTSSSEVSSTSSKLFQKIISDDDKDKAKHAELALAIATKVFVKIKPTIQLMMVHHPQDLSEEQDCVICFDKLSSEHKVVEITKFVQCNHAFHRDCTFNWLSRNQSCPYCRSKSFRELFC